MESDCFSVFVCIFYVCCAICEVFFHYCERKRLDLTRGNSLSQSVNNHPGIHLHSPKQRACPTSNLLVISPTKVTVVCLAEFKK